MAGRRRREEREKRRRRERFEEVERDEQLNMSNGMKTRPLHELERARGWGDRFYFLNPLDSVPSSPYFAGLRADEHAGAMFCIRLPRCYPFDRVDDK